ncbi:MAG: LPS export ABC transporter periplasmic protein LptC [Rhodothalassiaceae bacterium]
MAMSENAGSVEPTGAAPATEVYRYVSAYDRYVALMRILLPVLALLIAGMSFLWPVFTGGETSFLLNKDSMPGAGRSVRTVGAVFRGTDNAGRQYVIAAEEALQADPDAPLIRLTALDAGIALADGREAAFHADEGLYVTRSDRLSVPGAVRIETSDGYRLEGADAEIDLKERTLSSEKPVAGTGPLGRVSADGVHIDLESGKAEFIGHVRMLTAPRRKD